MLGERLYGRLRDHHEHPPREARRRDRAVRVVRREDDRAVAGPKVLHGLEVGAAVDDAVGGLLDLDTRGPALPSLAQPSAAARLDVQDLRYAVLDRDSDFDNGIIVHEYGHGISNRLTGGRLTTSCLATTYSGGGMTFESEQMGEGWSDYYALLLTDTNTDGRGIGTYAVYQPTDGQGIRPYRYSTDSFCTVLELCTGDDLVRLCTS